jgi:hypothetical protein
LGAYAGRTRSQYRVSVRVVGWRATVGGAVRGARGARRVARRVWRYRAYVLRGLAVDWWSLLRAEWVETDRFGF